MREIKHRLILFAAAGSLSSLASFLLIFRDTILNTMKIEPALIVTVLVSIFSIGILIVEYRRYFAAKLIVENKILQIQTAHIKEDVFGNRTSPLDGIEVVISCFGILLDSRVIRFNMNGIELKAVEIGEQWLCLAYGTGEKDHTITILHGPIGEEELRRVAERFRYETGIEPVIKNDLQRNC